MRRFAHRFGLRLDDVRGSENRFDDDDAVYVRGRFRTYGQYADRRVWRDVDRFYKRAFRLSRRLDPADPAAAGARHDRRSVADYFDQLGIGGRSREVLDREIRDDYAIEPEKLSLLFLLIETKVTWNTPDSGVEAFRVHGGNDQIARGLANRLRRNPHLGARVTEVRTTSRGVRVTAGGEDFNGDHVILAAALPGLRGVQFRPALLGRGVSIAWSNSPLNGGAYSAFAPGQVSDYWTALRRSHGRIHLAGEHTANLSGYMEGALRSGLRAARRIDAAEG